VCVCVLKGGEVRGLCGVTFVMYLIFNVLVRNHIEDLGEGSGS
jgi:hypothetical protein